MLFVYDRLMSNSSIVTIMHILTLFFFCLFQSLLEDPHPVVRSTGILGVTQITSKYWEMIPPTILADLLKKLTGELACDITSADVRCSVFKVNLFSKFKIMIVIFVFYLMHRFLVQATLSQGMLPNVPNTCKICTRFIKATHLE